MSALPRAARRLLVLVCRGPECGDKRNSAAVHRAFTAALRRVPPGTEVQLRWQSCFGQCQKGPNVMVRELKEKEDAFFLSFVATGSGERAALYHGIRPDDVERIIDEHILGGRVMEELKRRGTEGG